MRALLVLALLVGLSPPALSEDVTPYLHAEGVYFPPDGLWSFCRRYPAECLPHPPGSSYMVLTPERRAELRAINKKVNRGVFYIADWWLYKEDDWWTYPINGAGDCEDIALEKKKLLLEAGWPRSVMSLAFVSVENGRRAGRVLLGGHIVLIVRTNEGDLVLDIGDDEVVPWYMANIVRFVGRQSWDNPTRWERIDYVLQPRKVAFELARKK